MSALERPGKHRDIAFVVRLNTEAGRRMRWTFAADNGLTDSGVTSYGIEATYKAGFDAAQVAIDIAVVGKTTPGKGRKKSANGAAVDAFKNAIAAWARDSSDDNLTHMEKAQAAADAEAKAFYRTIGK